MRLTRRCLSLLELMPAARWLATSQVHHRFFPDATLDAARKRLRKLTESQYLAMYRQNRMAEALFTLGREGKRVLEKRRTDAITLEHRPPRQWEHFASVNDLRIEAELTGKLKYFFAYWELPALHWPHSIIPDAVFSMGSRTFAAEIDRGFEGIGFFFGPRSPRIGRACPAWRSSGSSSLLIERRGWSRWHEPSPMNKADLFSAPSIEYESLAYWRRCSTTATESQSPSFKDLFSDSLVDKRVCVSQITATVRITRKSAEPLKEKKPRLSPTRREVDPGIKISPTNQNMAWRPYENLIEGELDNTTAGKISGWISFYRNGKKPLKAVMDLEGDFHDDIHGKVIRFRNPKPSDRNGDLGRAGTYMQGFSAVQRGTAGDITAGLPLGVWNDELARRFMAKNEIIWEENGLQESEREARRKEWTERYRQRIAASEPYYPYVSYPYIEWYSKANGRVVLELDPSQVEILGNGIAQPREKTPGEHVEDDKRREKAMADFMADMARALSRVNRTKRRIHGNGR